MPLAVAYYARFRLIVNLLPLLQNAAGLRRVVTIFAATKEGQIDLDDMQTRKMGMMAQRGHMSSMTTLSLEAVAENASTVSFIHNFPGRVKTNYGRDVKGVMASVVRGVLTGIALVIGPFFFDPIDEVGERHLFFATSARFPARSDSGAGDGVPLPKGVAVARGTDGQTGSGVYSVSSHGESAPSQVEELLKELRKDGVTQKVWSHTQAEFSRITGAMSV